MIKCFNVTRDPSFLAKLDLPDFVKTASFIDADSARREDHDYALIVMEKEGSQRMYPVGTAALAWLSVEDFKANWEGMPKTAAAITARGLCGAAQLYDLEVPPVFKKLAVLAPEKSGRYYAPTADDKPIYLRPEAQTEKTASIASAGAVYPVGSEAELCRAEQWFDRNHFNMEQVEKYKMARFLGQRRQDFEGEKVAADRNLSRYPSREVTRVAALDAFNPKFASAMFQRVSICTDPEIAQEYAWLGLNEKVAQAQGVFATISAVERLDVNSGLRDSYGSWIPDAISSVLSVSREKLAEYETGENDAIGAATPVKWLPIKLASGNDDGEDVQVQESKVKKALRSDEVKKVLGPKVAEHLAVHTSDIAHLPSAVREFIYSRSVSAR